MIVLKILFLTLFYDYSILIKAQRNKCIAPEGNEGLCMNLWECTSRVKYIFSNNQNTVQTYNTVKSVCDYTNSMIKVCCPLSSDTNHDSLLQELKTNNIPCNNNNNGTEDIMTQLSFRIDHETDDINPNLSDQSKDGIDDTSEILSTPSYDDSDDTSAISSNRNSNDSDGIISNVSFQNEDGTDSTASSDNDSDDTTAKSPSDKSSVNITLNFSSLRKDSTDETTEVLFSSSDNESGEIIQNLSDQSENATNNTSKILFTSNDNDSIDIVANLSIQSEDSTDDTIAMSSGDNDSDEIVVKSIISSYTDHNIIIDEKLSTPTYNDTDSTTTKPFITNDNDSDNITKPDIPITKGIIPKTSMSSDNDSVHIFDEQSSTPNDNNSDDIITKSFISSENDSDNIITKSANPNDHGTDETIPKSSIPSFNGTDNIITKSAIPNSTHDIIVKSSTSNEKGTDNVIVKSSNPSDHGTDDGIVKLFSNDNSKSEEIENATSSKYDENDDTSSYMDSTESEMDEDKSEEDISTDNIGCSEDHSNENLNDRSLEMHSHLTGSNEVLESSKLIKKIKNYIKEMNNRNINPIDASDIKVAMDSGYQINNNTFIIINMNDKSKIFNENDSSIFTENDNTSEISDKATMNMLEKILCSFLYKTCNLKRLSQIDNIKSRKHEASVETQIPSESMDQHQEINDSPKNGTDIISSLVQDSEEYYYFSLPNPPHCGRNRKHNPLKGEFSWQVLLKEKENKHVKQLCKGTLITRQHIVTTAYCLKNREIESVLIRSQKLSAYITLKIKDIKVHENFVPNEIQNDIAIITLNTPIRLEETLPICLELNSNLIQNLTGLIAYTPGYIKETYEFAGEPRPKGQQVISLYECVNDLYNSKENFEIDESVLCTKSDPPTEDICLGSEGSPLVIRGKSRGRIHYYMIGIISEVNKCEANNQINIFVDISYHLNWILKNM